MISKVKTTKFLVIQGQNTGEFVAPMVRKADLDLLDKSNSLVQVHMWMDWHPTPKKMLFDTKKLSSEQMKNLCALITTQCQRVLRQKQLDLEQRLQNLAEVRDKLARLERGEDLGTFSFLGVKNMFEATDCLFDNDNKFAPIVDRWRKGRDKYRLSWMISSIEKTLPPMEKEVELWQRRASDVYQWLEVETTTVRTIALRNV